MNEQEMQEILENLASRGFNDDQLRSDIDRNEAYGLPRFSISRKKEFGDELMEYRLNFQWLERSLPYELTAIHANHRLPLDIDQNKVNVINSIQHDQKRLIINWTKYWEIKQKGDTTDSEFEMVKECIDGLAQLLLSESSQVKFTADLLMYKHWPADMFAIFSEESERMRRLYEHDYNFHLEDHPHLTADLAFLIISERIEAITMHLTDLGAIAITESAIKDEAIKRLKKIPGITELNFSFSNQEYFANLAVPIFLDKGWYNLEGYTLEVVQLPEITHGNFNGVDSERLDNKFSTINWREDKDIAFTENDSEVNFPKDIELLQEELFRIASDTEGKQVAESLMLKHWLTAPYFNDMITPSAMDRLAGLPVKKAVFPAEINIDEAVRLLSGRPVYLEDFKNNLTSGTWQRLSESVDGTTANIEYFQAISKKELEKIWNMLPVWEYRKDEMLQRLLDGMPAKVEAKSGDIIIIELTEKLDGLKIFDKIHQEIPFNFQLDPNWRQNQIPHLDPKASLKNDSTVSNKTSSIKRRGKSL